MIDELNKDDRLEFLVKTGLIENRFNTNRILTFSFAVIAIILMALDCSLAAWVSFFGFLLFILRDAIRFVEARKTLFNEYFEIKPRGKK